MKRVKNDQPQIEEPDIEVTVRAGGEELACIAFFPDGANTWDVLVGVSSPSLRRSLASTLRLAADGVEAAAFPTVDATSDEGGDSIPF